MHTVTPSKGTSTPNLYLYLTRGVYCGLTYLPHRFQSATTTLNECMWYQPQWEDPLCCVTIYAIDSSQPLNARLQVHLKCENTSFSAGFEFDFDFSITTCWLWCTVLLFADQRKEKKRRFSRLPIGRAFQCGQRALWEQPENPSADSIFEFSQLCAAT